jgi:hypothetical protein
MTAAKMRVPDFINHPTYGPTLRDVRKFFELTQLNEYPMNVESKDSPFGKAHRFKLENRGIVTMLRFDVTLTLTFSGFTTGTVTEHDKWIEGLIRRIRVVANGSEVFAGSAKMAKALVASMNDVPDLSPLVTKSVAEANTTQEFTFPVVVPLAADQSTAMGAIFAETAHTKLSCEFQFEDLDELLTLPGSMVVAESSVEIKPYVTATDVPTWQADNGTLLYVVPDLTVVSMVTEHATFPGSNGEKRVSITPSPGQLERILFHSYDASAKAYFNVLTQMEGYKLRYGQNQLLREHSNRDLLLRNILWYGERLPDQVMAFDLVVENSLRDSIVSEDALGLEVIHDYGTATVAADDECITLEHIVSPSVTWSKSQALG